MAIAIKSSLSLAPQAATSLIRFSELANIPCERRLLVYGGTESRRHRHYQQVGWSELEQHTGPWFEKGALPSGCSCHKDLMDRHGWLGIDWPRRNSKGFSNWGIKTVSGGPG